MRLHAGVAGVALFACVYGATVGTTAAAATLWTSNVGSDSGSCGTSSSPCRSISQAIENATDGDTIWVGPGHYGDVNGDGNFTGPGDEQPEPYAKWRRTRNSAGVHRLHHQGAAHLLDGWRCAHGHRGQRIKRVQLDGDDLARRRRFWRRRSRLHDYGRQYLRSDDRARIQRQERQRQSRT